MGKVNPPGVQFKSANNIAHNIIDPFLLNCYSFKLPELQQFYEGKDLYRDKTVQNVEGRKQLVKDILTENQIDFTNRPELIQVALKTVETRQKNAIKKKRKYVVIPPPTKEKEITPPKKSKKSKKSKPPNLVPERQQKTPSKDNPNLVPLRSVQPNHRPAPSYAPFPAHAGPQGRILRPRLPGLPGMFLPRPHFSQPRPVWNNFSNGFNPRFTAPRQDFFPGAPPYRPNYAEAGSSTYRWNYSAPNFYTRPTPPPIPEEVTKEQKLAKERQSEAIERNLKEIREREKTQRKVEELRNRLKEKKKTGDQEEESEQEDGELSEEGRKSQDEEDENGGVTTDLLLSNEDFRHIGSGHVVVPSRREEDQPVHPVDVYLRLGEREMHGGSEEARERVANEPGWHNPEWWEKKKAREEAAAKRDRQKRQRSESEASSSAKRSRMNINPLSKEERQRQDEFRRMTANLKGTILMKDKDFLQELIDSPSLMKKKLMSNLVRERQQQISEQLNKLRFGTPSNITPATATSAASAASTSQAANHDPNRNLCSLADIKALESDSACLATVDLEELPGVLIAQIEDLIMTETLRRPREETQTRAEDVHIVRKEVVPTTEAEVQMLDEEEEEIVEIPIPPKAPAPVVTLDDEGEPSVQEKAQEEGTQSPLRLSLSPYDENEDEPDENEEEPEAEPGSPVKASSKFDMLRLLGDEEKNLFSELKELEGTRTLIMERLSYIRDLRMEMINSAAAEEEEKSG